MRISPTCLMVAVLFVLLPAASPGQDWCENWGDYEPAWSPVGSRLAASGWLFHGPPMYMLEFWLRAYDVEGGSIRGYAELYFGGSTRPTWTPDGSEVVFTEYRNLMAVNLEDRQWRFIAALPGDIRDPAWSPDGAWIALSCQEGGFTDIWVMDPRGQQQRRLTQDAAADRHPAWSPDSRSIAFASNRGGDDDIWVVSLQGGEPTRLTQGPSNDTWPSWSPDGRFLAFTSDRSGGLDLWVLPLDRTDPVRITTDAGSETGPAWSPNGSSIAFRYEAGPCTHIQVIPVPRIIAVERTSWSGVKRLYR